MKATILLLLLVSIDVAAECVPRTELEGVYCQLQERGTRLPSMAEFRRNTSATQVLLLKRPAARAGIDLPKAAKPTARNSLATESKIEPGSAKTKSIAKSQPVPIATTLQTRSKEEATRAAVQLGDHCTLMAKSIRCDKVSFQLLDNLNNRHVDKKVFADDYRLGLENFSHSAADDSLVHRHLSRSYSRYIEAMIELGLGASTMTYTRFYYTYDDAHQQQRDFAERLEKMFHYLKKDKQSMGVKKRYNDNLPSGLNQCSQLNDRVIICDDKINNWLYQKIDS